MHRVVFVFAQLYIFPLNSFLLHRRDRFFRSRLSSSLLAQLAQLVYTACVYLSPWGCKSVSEWCADSLSSTTLFQQPSQFLLSRVSLRQTLSRRSAQDCSHNRQNLFVSDATPPARSRSAILLRTFALTSQGERALELESCVHESLAHTLREVYFAILSYATLNNVHFINTLALDRQANLNV